MDDHHYHALCRSMRQLRWMVAAQLAMALVALALLAVYITPA